MLFFFLRACVCVSVLKKIDEANDISQEDLSKVHEQRKLFFCNDVTTDVKKETSYRDLSKVISI